MDKECNENVDVSPSKEAMIGAAAAGPRQITRGLRLEGSLEGGSDKKETRYQSTGSCRTWHSLDSVSLKSKCSKVQLGPAGPDRSRQV